MRRPSLKKLLFLTIKYRTFALGLGVRMWRMRE